ncbi:hypothetical protein C666_02980 [Thauera linaloolentis 47Lol = DSM 12138]|uniref:Purine nucleoside phosphorylase n=1 Tax=Thauera linaloolentis (strain DSM 12138 / JCM 21573 / CCUG 41526 / CIP 105981 / IAM 15112 / NBRC 102519 / 47Lol) TaxID=1123367 RepID=N6Z739_THAL4|nr:hypothetical protein C666_02980 [Thauera linaloolentis 47Lol = DSM 12138]
MDLCGVLRPDWTTPANVRALLTTRAGGCSLAPYDGFNLAKHVGDVPAAVARNRAMLRELLPAEPVWLSQVHGCAVADAAVADGVLVADAVVAREPGRVCVVMTADCLPVLLCDDDGSVVAAAHAGWRGLAGGVLEATIERMAVAPGRLRAWLGPAIGPDCFEVGDEVREVFVSRDPEAADAFVAAPAQGKWMADLFALARRRLKAAGVGHVEGGGVCTVRDPERFYSYRRDGRTGRFASIVWLEPAPDSACRGLRGMV